MLFNSFGKEMYSRGKIKDGNECIQVIMIALMEATGNT